MEVLTISSTSNRCPRNYLNKQATLPQYRMDYPIYKAITSKPRLVASVERQDQQTPPCLQAVVDVNHVNIRIDIRSALNINHAEQR